MERLQRDLAKVRTQVMETRGRLSEVRGGVKEVEEGRRKVWRVGLKAGVPPKKIHPIPEQYKTAVSNQGLAKLRLSLELHDDYECRSFVN
jgi:hypothetical protein